MRLTPNAIVASQSVRRVLLFAATVLPLVLTGCDTGYHANTSTGQVVLVTWDEGHGRREWPVEGADAATFRELEIEGIRRAARDKDHLYTGTVRVEGADPNTFRKAGDHYRDDESVFLRVDRQYRKLPSADPETFTRLDPYTWSRDSQHVFYEDRIVPIKHIESFQRLDGQWARDNETIVHRYNKLEEVDLDTFEVNATHNSFAADQHHIYWKGFRVKRCDPATFVATSYNKGRDKHGELYLIFKGKHHGERFREQEAIETHRPPKSHPNRARTPGAHTGNPSGQLNAE